MVPEASRPIRRRQRADLSEREGTIADDRNIRQRHFWPILVKGRLPSIRLYDLRHTAATLLYHKSGFNVKAVQDMLGHATFALTMDTYTHASDDSLRDGAALVNASLEEAVARAKREQIRLVASG